MCLIVFAWQVVPGAPLIAAANRDEFYDRPATPAAAWPDKPSIYAGRDLQGGGSWMGINQQGPHGARFAALTNIRGPRERRSDAPSRGALVADYLAGELDAEAYIARIADGSVAYNGFNLVLGDRDKLYWFSNRGMDDPRNGKELAPGIYGISNGLLDAPWPRLSIVTTMRPALSRRSTQLVERQFTKPFDAKPAAASKPGAPLAMT